MKTKGKGVTDDEESEQPSGVVEEDDLETYNLSETFQGTTKMKQIDVRGGGTTE